MHSTPKVFCLSMEVLFTIIFGDFEEKNTKLKDFFCNYITIFVFMYQTHVVFVSTLNSCNDITKLLYNMSKVIWNVQSTTTVQEK